MDKLILVHYLNLIGGSIASIKGQCAIYSRMLEDQSDDDILHFIMISNENKIECVNPKLISSDEYQSVLTKLEEFKTKQDEFLKNQEIGSEN
jgi:hypothetical protein